MLALLAEEVLSARRSSAGTVNVCYELDGISVRGLGFVQVV